MHGTEIQGNKVGVTRAGPKKRIMSTILVLYAAQHEQKHAQICKIFKIPELLVMRPDRYIGLMVEYSIVIAAWERKETSD